MKISVLLFRCRYWLLALVAVLGFWSPWERIGNAHPNAHLGTTWLYLAGALARSRILPIAYSSAAVMGAAILLAVVAAMLRTWAASYTHRGTTRNAQSLALYVGLWLHMLALSILMPPVGALFTIAVVTAAIGALIATTSHSVPETHRASDMSADITPPRWGRALLREIYFWGAAITYLAFASRYNVTVVEQGVLVSLGVAVILQGVLRPGAKVAG